MAEGSRLLIAGFGLGDVDLLGLRRLGQGLQFRFGLKPQAELTVGIESTQQRRQPHDLQEQQRTVLSHLLQRKAGVKKAVGALEDIQLRGKEKQARKQQQADVGRLIALCPGQELPHGAVTANAQHKI